jgi:hypothetical protein
MTVQRSELYRSAPNGDRWSLVRETYGTGVRLKARSPERELRFNKRAVKDLKVWHTVLPNADADLTDCHLYF